jgi:hypothetical protein
VAMSQVPGGTCDSGKSHRTPVRMKKMAQPIPSSRLPRAPPASIEAWEHVSMPWVPPSADEPGTSHRPRWLLPRYAAGVNEA